MQMKAMKCENCRWWERRFYAKDIAAHGDCHRFPPNSRKVIAATMTLTKWPSMTYEFDWCGEFESREKSESV